jgi:oligoribonuclease NrnB/cAMP/cGMP phosphodiesterase (DHH superfamily)
MNETRQLFIYHGNCFDGFTAAWIWSRFYLPHLPADAVEYYPAKYGETPPDVKGRPVIIADFSYPRDVMKQIIRDASGVTIFDHHHTAQEALEGINEELAEGYAPPTTWRSREDVPPFATITFDMNRSGAGIVWDYVEGMNICEGTGNGPRPPLVNYVEDRDLWRKALPGTDEFAAAVSAAPMTFESWDELHARGMANVERGAAILDYIRQYGTKALAEAHMECWLRLAPEVPKAIWCVNLPYMNCSEHVGRLLEERGGPFAAGYFRRGDGRWQFSLRSCPDFDCSAVAKLYGGGGHKQAAGFDVANLSEVFAAIPGPAGKE